MYRQKHFGGLTLLVCGPRAVFWLKPSWQMPCFTSCPQGDSLRTNIQLDFGDGIKVTYANLSRMDDGIKHVYRTTGIYRVTARAENSQGSDSSTLFLHVTSTWIWNIIPHPHRSSLSLNSGWILESFTKQKCLPTTESPAFKSESTCWRMDPVGVKLFARSNESGTLIMPKICSARFFSRPIRFWRVLGVK